MVVGARVSTPRTLALIPAPLHHCPALQYLDPCTPSPLPHSSRPVTATVPPQRGLRIDSRHGSSSPSSAIAYGAARAAASRQAALTFSSAPGRSREWVV